MPSNSTRVPVRDLVTNSRSGVSSSVASAEGPIHSPKSVTISPGATAPPAKLAAFTTPPCEILGPVTGAPPQRFNGDREFRGFGDETEKSTALLPVSMQPFDLLTA